MKTQILLLLPLSAALVAGCARHAGAYTPVSPKLTPEQVNAKFVLMDKPTRYSVTSTGLMETRTNDGRLQVSCQILNREHRRIQVQVQCVFKEAQGFSTTDETPWQDLILTENATETVQFTSMNTQAATYTIRVRQAR